MVKTNRFTVDPGYRNHTNVTWLEFRVVHPTLLTVVSFNRCTVDPGWLDLRVDLPTVLTMVN